MSKIPRLPHFDVQGISKIHPKHVNSARTKTRPEGERTRPDVLKAQLMALSTEFEQRRLSYSPIDNESVAGAGRIVVLVNKSASQCPLPVEKFRTVNRRKSSGEVSILREVVSQTLDRETDTEQIVLWIAESGFDEFTKHFGQYIESWEQHLSLTDALDQKVKLQAHYSSVDTIRAANLEDLWTGGDLPRLKSRVWLEMWFLVAAPEDLPKVETQMRNLCQRFSIELRARMIHFRHRLVAWVHTSIEDLQPLLHFGLPFAEIRRARFFESSADLNPAEQGEYINDARERLIEAAPEAPVVTLLDSGVNRGHELLRDSLDNDSIYTIYESGTKEDIYENEGHGTLIAGLVLFGDKFEEFLESTRTIALSHRLESVRMLPTECEARDSMRDYGTAQTDAVALPEIDFPNRQRVFCLTLTDLDEEKTLGQPSLWSTTLDALAFGSDVSTGEDDSVSLLTSPEEATPRLFIVAAGNVRGQQLSSRTNYDESIFTIQDPGQTWNGLTVGAFTDLDSQPLDPDFEDWQVIADAGEISPFSRTSVQFEGQWPIKPDICMEGGNVLVSPSGTDFHDKYSGLSLCSTSKTGRIGLANATSAATGQASRLAAMIAAQYPQYWPETIRGLLVHRAEWTGAMNAELRQGSLSKEQKVRLLRKFGWGCPTEERVLYDDLSNPLMIIQGAMFPYEGDSKKSMKHLVNHELPWPSEVLEQLGETEVRLRVTLSYFIEPNGAHFSKKDRFMYASHALRFDLQNSTESQEEFLQRCATSAKVNGGNWLIGPQKRVRGSLIQDEWVGTGAELAACNNIVVSPAAGWWKYSKDPIYVHPQVRYSLLVSLSVDAEVDLYTPIKAQLSTPITVEAN
ncbi:S8 family peptidase [Corynebacterium ulcerans]|uniref:S8 family peptidase n=1 Tax=Corynebacterium ulcerans TaxID=65058 RepID=UPI0034A2349F